ncbi:hypothetical protein GCM10010471_07200 [Leucobacter komagatae]
MLELSDLDRVNARSCANEATYLQISESQLAILPVAGESVSAFYVADASGISPTDYSIYHSESSGIGVQLAEPVIAGQPLAESTATFGSTQAIEEFQDLSLEAGTAKPLDEGHDPRRKAIQKPCISTEYASLGWRQSRPVEWRWSTLPYPGDSAMAGYGAPAIIAARWITTPKSVCEGLPAPGSNGLPEWGPKQNYLGLTSARGPNVSVPPPGAAGSVTCAPPDGFNTAGLYSLSQGFSDRGRPLAVACVHSTVSGGPYDSDIAFDLRRNWNDDLTRCVTPWSPNGVEVYDMYTVALHEWGHVYGLGHVPAITQQIMRPAFGACERMHGLGSGDWYGLLYYG